MIDNSLEAVLQATGCLCTPIKGTSMTPLMDQNRDKAYIELVKKPIKKSDVLLYKRRDGTYVLHRVMKVTDIGYTMCGDSHYMLEYGIKDDQVLGICKGFYKKSKYVDFDKSFSYKLYVLLWCKSLKMRRLCNLFRRFYHLCIRIFAKIFHIKKK